MNTDTEQAGPPIAEFVIIISLMMSLTALSIDAMLPALPQIAVDLGVQDANDRQLVISELFLGLALGQLFFGPLSDRVGRTYSFSVSDVMVGMGRRISFSTVSPDSTCKAVSSALALTQVGILVAMES